MKQFSRLWKRNTVPEEKSPSSSPSAFVGNTMSDTAQSINPSRDRGVEQPSLRNVGRTTSASDQPSAPCTPSNTAPIQPDDISVSYAANMIVDLATAQVDAEPSSEGKRHLPPLK
jgi:hypothetical protein